MSGDDVKVLVTGGTGFLGGQLIRAIRKSGRFNPILGVRSGDMPYDGVESLVLGDLKGYSEIDSSLLEGVDVVVHTAARAHRVNEPGDDLSEYLVENVDATVFLARAAAKARVKRFIYISSIGVNGAHTSDAPFSEISLPAPHASYAVSKHEAERALLALVENTHMELVIIRPPLVYAAHAPGNFAKLLKLIRFGVPMPFSLVRNQRSMVALENLVDFIELCIEHPLAVNQTFLISDGIDVSTPQMVRYLAEGMGKKPRLVPIPINLMRWGAEVAGKQGMFDQLCGSLVIDSTKATRQLGWQPPLKVDEALIKAGQEYQRRH